MPNETLLLAADKQLLDNYNEYTGGFGISINGKIITGDIKIQSNTIQFDCDGTIIQAKLSDNFINGLCLNIDGPRGKPGKQGLAGKPGKHGVGQGPIGEPGSNGINNQSPIKLKKLKFVDSSDIVDKSIVKIDISNGNKLVLKSGKLNVPDNLTPADSVVATPISVSIEWTGTLTQYTVDNGSYNLVKLISNTNSGSAITSYSVNDLISDTIKWYNNRLVKIDQKYQQDIKKYIADKDQKARETLAELNKKLWECEANTQPDLAVQLTKCAPDSVELPDPDPIIIPSTCSCSNADILLLVDTTGSMGSFISNIKAAFTAITSKLSSTSCRFAIADYKDCGDGAPYNTDYIKVWQVFTGTLTDVEEAISHLSAGGGGGTPEQWGLTLNKLATEWETIVGGSSEVDSTGEYVQRRVIIFGGDAPTYDNGPGESGCVYPALTDVATALRDAKIIVYCIDTGVANGANTSPISSGGVTTVIGDSTPHGRIFNADDAKDPETLSDTLCQIIGELGTGTGTV